MHGALSFYSLFFTRVDPVLLLTWSLESIYLDSAPDFSAVQWSSLSRVLKNDLTFPHSISISMVVELFIEGFSFVNVSLALLMVKQEVPLLCFQAATSFIWKVIGTGFQVWIQSQMWLWCHVAPDVTWPARGWPHHCGCGLADFWNTFSGADLLTAAFETQAAPS